VQLQGAFRDRWRGSGCAALPHITAASVPAGIIGASFQTAAAAAAATCHPAPAAAAGHSRRLRVTANPNITVTKAHVPWHCRRARVVLLGPLTLHDVDAASFATQQGALQTQQQQRRLPQQQLAGNCSTATCIVKAQCAQQSPQPGIWHVLALALQPAFMLSVQGSGSSCWPAGSWLALWARASSAHWGLRGRCCRCHSPALNCW
jgi:hypothetical protein